jgi:hypothetical protein
MLVNVFRLLQYELKIPTIIDSSLSIDDEIIL